MRKELTEANNRCNENRDDIRIVKATIASTPSATSGVGTWRKGVQEDRAASEAGASTLPAMAADGQHSLGQNTPAPSVCGGGHAGRRDASRGRDADSVTLGSGGLLGADYRQRREQCDLCGEYSEERDMHPCPRCRNRICTTCSQGYGACPLCDNDARHERTSDAGPIGARPFRGNLMNSENTRGREKCEKIVIKGEPQANTIQVWITDVAMQARSAYGFGPDHAFKVVSDVLRHPDSRLDTKIVYSHLENALFQGLMGCITSRALASDVRVRMMQRNTPLCALRLMKIIIGHFRVSEENEETLYANSLAATRLANDRGGAESRRVFLEMGNAVRQLHGAGDEKHDRHCDREPVVPYGKERQGTSTRCQGLEKPSLRVENHHMVAREDQKSNQHMEIREELHDSSECGT